MGVLLQNSTMYNKGIENFKKSLTDYLNEIGDSTNENAESIRNICSSTLDDIKFGKGFSDKEVADIEFRITLLYDEIKTNPT
jgi:hypothetical protein